MEADDVLAHEVEVRRPAVLQLGLVVRAVAQGGEVVDEGVDPHVGDVLGVEGQGHAPVEGGAADGEVVHAALHKAHDLVAADFRADELGVGLVVGDQLVAELAQLEEPVLLLDGLHGAAAVGAAAVDEVVFVEEGLAGGAVEALVGVLVEVAVVIEGLQELLDAGDVALLGGADEVVVGDVEVAPELLELGELAVAPLLGGHAVLGCGLRDLLAVLVEAGEEVHVLAVEAVEAGDGVCRDSGVGGSDVGLAVDVVDGGGDVERGLAHDALSCRMRMMHVTIQYNPVPRPPLPRRQQKEGAARASDPL